MIPNIYYKEDIAQSIVAVAIAVLGSAVAHGGSNVEYCRGVLDTARAQAVNYGISWQSVVNELRELLADCGQAEILDRCLVIPESAGQ